MVLYHSILLKDVVYYIHLLLRWLPWWSSCKKTSRKDHATLDKEDNSAVPRRWDLISSFPWIIQPLTRETTARLNIEADSGHSMYRRRTLTPKYCSNQLRKPDHRIHRNHCRKPTISLKKPWQTRQAITWSKTSLFIVPVLTRNHQKKSNMLSEPITHFSSILLTFHPFMLKTSNWYVPKIVYFFPTIKPVFESLKNTYDSDAFMYGKLFMTSLSLSANRKVERKDPGWSLSKADMVRLRGSLGIKYAVGVVLISQIT